jgi:homoserine O-acetyltransferase
MTLARSLLLVGVLGVTTAIACSPAPKPREADSALTTAMAGRLGDGELQFADLGSCRLDSGETIEECRIGYRTFGKLDATKSNVVLFPTWFTGTTKTLVDIVPEKIVDTKKFHLVLVDSLGDGVSSSPSTSRKQPRLRFPKFTIHDMVESQRRLLREVLGVQKVNTVMGISMGGMQAFEWAVSHPREVGRIVPIVGTPQLTAQDLLLWNAELHTLQGSKEFANGDYAEPRPKIPALQELHWLMLTTPSHRNAETTGDGYAAWITPLRNDTAFDWNDWHRQLEAMLAHDVARGFGGDLGAAAQKVEAKALVIVAEQDHMVNPAPSKTFAKAMNANLVVLDTPCGHMAPSCEASIGTAVRKFLSE